MNFRNKIKAIIVQSLEVRPGLVWLVPLIAAGVSLIGTVISANAQKEAAEKQRQATEDANKISNAQWQSEMALNEKTANANIDIKNKELQQNSLAAFNSKLEKYPTLSKTLINIWGGQ